MAAKVDESACLTVDDAIRRTQTRLDDLTVQFDRWASQNPLLMAEQKNEYIRSMRTEMKVTRLKLKELYDMKQCYDEQTRPLTTYKAVTPGALDEDLSSKAYSKRAKTPIDQRSGNLVTQR